MPMRSFKRVDVGNHSLGGEARCSGSLRRDADSSHESDTRRNRVVQSRGVCATWMRVCNGGEAIGTKDVDARLDLRRDVGRDVLPCVADMIHAMRFDRVSIGIQRVELFSLHVREFEVARDHERHVR
jgi:hypothetical protein